MTRIAAITGLVLVGFAANNLMCRAAIRGDHIDPATFTAVRLISGALALYLLSLRSGRKIRGSWAGGIALWAYAALYSFAYATLGAGTGALLLMGAVQLTMVGPGLWSGERLSRAQVAGWLMAAVGVLWLVMPGLAAPHPLGAILMILAGTAWGVYSLEGKAAGFASDPINATAGNFLRSAPLAALSFLPFAPEARTDLLGVLLALTSGVLTSGLCYSLWYSVIPDLGALRAALLQLSVPILAGFGGILFLAEAPTVRLGISALLVLGGASLALLSRRDSVRLLSAIRPPEPLAPYEPLPAHAGTPIPRPMRARDPEPR